jgi:hypothetical protein
MPILSKPPFGIAIAIPFQIRVGKILKKNLNINNNFFKIKIIILIYFQIKKF